MEPSVRSRIVVNSVTTRVPGRFLSSEPNLAWLLQNYCALQVLLLRLTRVILTRHALEGIAWNWVLKISHHEYVEVKASLYFLFPRDEGFSTTSPWGPRRLKR